MSTQKQKFVYIFALVLSFALGMLTMTGCAYFSQEKVAGTVSTVLEIAYVAGGATHVEQYNEQTICMTCKEKEQQRSDYRKAVESDHAEIRKGNYNFQGIGLDD